MEYFKGLHSHIRQYSQTKSRYPLHFISRDWQRMTMETIASCAFGIDANSIKDPNSPFLQKCRGFFEQVEKITPLSRIVAMCLCMFYKNYFKPFFLQKSNLNYASSEKSSV